MKRHSIIFIAALAGCGPARIANTDDSSGAAEADTSSSTTEPLDTGTDYETETGPFPPDFGLPPRPTPCDPFEKDCPAGQKCVPYASDGNDWNAYKCVPVLGDQAPGEACVYDGPEPSTDDCDATGFCWQVTEVDGELHGTCHVFCGGTDSEPECPPMSACLISSGTAPIVCVATCDPIEQDCDPGLACYWANNSFNCTLTTEDIPAGQPCGYINDCAAGNACILAEVVPDCAGASCCAPFCDLSVPSDPTCDVIPGTSCVAFFEQDSAPAGYENIGICIVP